jgi:hypothetical protein
MDTKVDVRFIACSKNANGNIVPITDTPALNRLFESEDEIFQVMEDIHFFQCPVFIIKHASLRSV